MSDLIKRINSDTHPNIFVDIVLDPYPEEPDTFPVYITYSSGSRYKLGNQQLNNHEHSKVARKIRDGEYVGLPVWAYVHGGSQIAASETNPFSCPWDSGQSGWAYVTPPQMKLFYGDDKAAALADLKVTVEGFSNYLQREVYGWQLRVDDVCVNSCYGFYSVEDAEDAARYALIYQANKTPLQYELDLGETK